MTQEVQDKPVESGIKWSNIITSLILFSILGAWGSAWSNQKQMNKTFKDINLTMATIAQAVAINTLTIEHNDDACSHRFKEAMKEIKRLYGLIEDHKHK